MPLVGHLRRSLFGALQVWVLRRSALGAETMPEGPPKGEGLPCFWLPMLNRVRSGRTGFYLVIAKSLTIA